MAKGFNTLRVKSAVKSRSDLDLSFTHLTTMDFGQIQPLMARETIPGDDFTVQPSFFSRMAPLARPTYGKFSFKTVYGFVPYHMVADDVEAWLAGKTTWEGSATHFRYITLGDLVLFLVNYATESTGPAETDIAYTDTEDEVLSYTLTPTGRYYAKVLNSLGYAIPQNFKYSSDASKKLSAYPLLAFFKLYNDYMSQSQRYNTSQLSNFLRSVKHGLTVDGFAPATGRITQTGIDQLFHELVLNYENDYFTSAWRYPNAPVNNDQSITGVFVPGMSADFQAEMGKNDNILYSDQDDYLANIQQRALDFLKSFDDWVRRNNYSGSRAVQQVYSRFGIKTSDFRSNYAEVLDTKSFPIQVGDVTATADTSGSALGEYAGKGIMNSQDSFRFQASDYGMLFVLGYFTVVPMNGYGFDRSVLRTEPLDFYNPEFDGIGAEAISAGEYFTDPASLSEGDASSDSDVFGYTERYNSYRFSRDLITGDFRLPSMSDMDVWHTGRLLTNVRRAGELVAQSPAINTMPQTASEYNRIFGMETADVDHFYLTANFNVKAIRPILDLNQVTKLGEGDTTVARNGNVIA